MAGPGGWRCVIDRVQRLRARSAFHQKTNYSIMAGEGGLVQRGGVSVCAGRIVPIGIFTRIEQEPHGVDTAELGGERESAVASGRVGSWQKRL